MEQPSEIDATGVTRRAKFWTVLAVLGAFLFGLPALLFGPAEWTLFEPQVYARALERSGFYERYPAILGDTLAGSGDALLPGVGTRLLGALDRARYEDIARMIFPGEWVRVQAESLIDQFWAYFNFEQETLRLEVDLGPVKARLQGEESLPIVQELVAGLPACTEDEIFQFGLDVLQGKTADLPLCRPPEALIGFTNEVVAALLRGSTAAIPERVDLAGGLSAARSAAEAVGAPVGAPRWTFASFRAMRRAVPWQALAAALCVVGAGVAGSRTRRGAAFWSGLALALPGLVGLVIALLLALWSSQAVPLFLSRFFVTNLALFQTVVSVVVQAAGQYLTWLAGISLALGVIGVALVAFATYRRDRRRLDPQEHDA